MTNHYNLSEKTSTHIFYHTTITFLQNESVRGTLGCTTMHPWKIFKGTLKELQLSWFFKIEHEPSSFFGNNWFWGPK